MDTEDRPLQLQITGKISTDEHPLTESGAEANQDSQKSKPPVPDLAEGPSIVERVPDKATTREPEILILCSEVDKEDLLMGQADNVLQTTAENGLADLECVPEGDS